MMAVTGWTELYGAVDCPTRSLSEDSPCTRRSEIGHEYFLAHLNREHRAFQHLLTVVSRESVSTMMHCQPTPCKGT